MIINTRIGLKGQVALCPYRTILVLNFLTHSYKKMLAFSLQNNNYLKTKYAFREQKKSKHRLTLKSNFQ